VDNISKAMAGVLGIAGIIAFLTPTDVSFAPNPAVPLAPPAVAELPPVPQAPTPTASPITDEDLVMGQPTIDGKPFVDGNPVIEDPANNIQSSTEQAQQPSGNIPQPYPGYTLPQEYGMQPQPMLPGNEVPRPT
jgi:hypothetical protein